MDIYEQRTLVPGVGALLIHEGKYLLQLRDDNPAIAHPNLWGLVGGGVEPGEEPDEAIRRECQEEIGLIPSGLTYLGRIQYERFRYYAYLTDDEAGNLILGEGQEIRFFKPEEILRLNTTPRVKIMFNDFRDAMDKLVNRELVHASEVGLEV